MKKRFIAYLLSSLIFTASIFVGNAPMVQAVDTDAVCGEGFIVKENMELYATDSSLNSIWNSMYSSAVSLSLETENTSRIYGGSGRSLKCSYDFTKTENGSEAISFYYNDKIYNEDLNGIPLGYDSQLGFWIYTDSNINLFLTALDSVTYGTVVKTSTVALNEGAHFVTFDWKDFNNNSTGIYDFIYQLKFAFTSENSTGNIWIDQIGIVQLDVGSVTHGDGFYEHIVADNKWVNKNESTATITSADGVSYHSGNTNITANTTALQVNYTSITNSSKANFYYNSDLRINRNSYVAGNVSDNLYGEDTVLAFWVRADKPLTLEFNYADKNLSNTTIYSNKFTANLEAGESIITVPLADLMPNKQAAYYWVYQLQLWISNIDTLPVSGSLYIDAIGFYNSNTDKEFSEKLSAVSEVSPKTAEQINDILYYYTELNDNEKQNITSRTMYSYNKLMSSYNIAAPKISMPDTIDGDDLYADGTLTFDIEIDNALYSEYTVTEIGAVMHRKAIVTAPHRLAKETEDCVVASKTIENNKNNYRETVIFKCFDDATAEDFEGYLRTDYLFRAFITYTDSDGQSYTVYSNVYDTSSNRIQTEDENVQRAIDNSTDTAWEVTDAGTYSLYFDFDEPKTFNSIDFCEKSQGEYSYTDANGNPVNTNTNIFGITDFSVALSDDGKEWNEVYSQDEMGIRTVVLDDTYTASHIRINLTTDMAAGICEATFKNTEKFNKNLRVVSYVRMSEDITEYTENIQALTDIIFIDYGSWNQKGEFIFTDNGGDGGASSKAALTDRIAKIKQINPNINMWFSLRRVTLEDNELKTDVFSNTTDKDALINTCLGLCTEYGFKGIDFDFEYPDGTVQLANYNNFLIELGKALHNNNYMLSVATSDFVNHTESAKYIDYVNLMAYDRITLDRFGRHNTANAIYRQIDKIVANGFSKEQINLGLGFYGKALGGTNSVTYKGLVRQYYDTTINGGNTYASGFYCAGTSLVADKVILALQQDLCGVFSWSLTTDLPLSHELSLAGSVDKTIERFCE